MCPQRGQKPSSNDLLVSQGSVLAYAGGGLTYKPSAPESTSLLAQPQEALAQH